ncbi:LysR family transcriptional regulator [Persicimonas caeni]|uniref:LysR family transcriptional regulator n=1 Tax=Persicimonas caeni TaxID=2292766 RepID=A0A4Y6PZA6_PERCE|nr:LysR family transcriptional regulator [Persicimonas caeni]QDG53632.1 LysR family transcriptional regulator [Persicimonas caeni]QED34853.1 LysR family transcriptional regulator [Persicimonas caeni]
MKLDLDALEALDAVIEAGSFAAAAERLHKAQSAVSYAIRKLEERLGVELFDRSGHRAELTEAGRTVLEEGRHLLASARRLETVAQQLAHGWEARLEVIIDGILPMSPIMGVLKTLADEEVPTHIQVKMEYLGGVQYRFLRDRADMMVVKDFEPEENLTAHPLAQVTVVLVAGAQHPLGQIPAGEELELPELQQHVELTIQDSSARGSQDEHMFGGSRTFYLSGFHNKKEALLRGLGYGWLPLYMCAEELAAGTLVEVPYVSGSRYEFTPMLVHRSDRPLGRAGKLFAERVREEFASGEWRN